MREIVLKEFCEEALEALEIPYSYEGQSLIEVQIPPDRVDTFGGFETFTLCFDPTVRSANGDVDLVTPGCFFLDRLRESLDRAGRTARIIVRQAPEWSDLDSVLMAVRDHLDLPEEMPRNLTGEAVRHDLLELLFEVTFEGTSKWTELVPIAWDRKKKTSRSPGWESVLGQGRYDPSELPMEAAPDPPTPTELRDAVRQSTSWLKVRFAPLVHNELEPMRRRTENQRQALQAYYLELIDDAPDRKDLLEKELDQKLRTLLIEADETRLDIRLIQIAALHYPGYRIRLELPDRDIELTVELDCDQAFDLLEEGRIFPCAECQLEKNQFLGPHETSDRKGLLCTDCGARCGECGELYLLKEAFACSTCRKEASVCRTCNGKHWSTPAALRIIRCAHRENGRRCSQRLCVDHRKQCRCHERYFCPEHLVSTEHDRGIFCPEVRKHCPSCNFTWANWREPTSSDVCPACRNATLLPEESPERVLVEILDPGARDVRIGRSEKAILWFRVDPLPASGPRLQVRRLEPGTCSVCRVRDCDEPEQLVCDICLSLSRMEKLLRSAQSSFILSLIGAGGLAILLHFALQGVGFSFVQALLSACAVPVVAALPLWIWEQWEIRSGLSIESQKLSGALEATDCSPDKILRSIPAPMTHLQEYVFKSSHLLDLLEHPESADD